MIKKAINGKDESHNISRNTIRKLDSGVSSAVATIIVPERNSFVFVTDLTEAGKPIVITFAQNQVFDGDHVHQATSIHKRMNFSKYISSLEDAIVIIHQKEKFNRIARENDILVRFNDSVKLLYKDSTASAESQVNNSTRNKRYMELAKDPEANKAELQEMVDEKAKEWGALEETGKPKHSTMGQTLILLFLTIQKAEVQWIFRECFSALLS